jgi:hypothetical protein
MAHYFTVFAILIFSILLVVPFTESIRCLNNCTFQNIPMNSSISSNICASSDESKNLTNQLNSCVVSLIIDFTTGLVNGSFNVEEPPAESSDYLFIITTFSLNDTSVKVNIEYDCSVSNDCDLQFVRETLSPAMAAVQVEPLRQKLVTGLYNPNNTGPVKCSNNGACPQNRSLCYAEYTHENVTYGGLEKIHHRCVNSVAPKVDWLQLYTPYSQSGLHHNGVLHCNTPNCDSNSAMLETFRWLAREYILPLNVSVLNVTTKPQPTRTTATTTTTAVSTTVSTTTTTTAVSTTVSTTLTTTSNYASFLFGHFNSLAACLVIILFLY